jgi:hypothetical protein
MISLNLEYEEIYPLIFVYHNLLDNHEDLTSIIKSSEKNSKGKYYLHDWTPWFVFGTYTYEKRFEEQLEADRTNFMYGNEQKLCERISEANNSAISHYIGINNIKLPKGSYITRSNYAKYDAGVKVSYHKNEEQNNSDRMLVMNYHTDYNIGEWYWPNDKFFITCTAYINDDYDGGELRFFVDGDIILYKPKAGDLVVFPSGSPLYPGTHPYFHAVGQVENGEKFLTRTYVKHSSSITQEWIDGEKEFGEDWPKIAQEKAAKAEHNTLHFHDDPKKTKKIYKNVSVWESSLIEKLYNKKTY